MRRTLTCDAVLNFPMPNIHQLSAQLQAMYDGTQPVPGRQLAAAFQLSENALVPVLRRCEERGMIRNVRCRGWIPVQQPDK
jgi:hypothetical protein